MSDQPVDKRLAEIEKRLASPEAIAHPPSDAPGVPTKDWEPVMELVGTGIFLALLWFCTVGNIFQGYWNVCALLVVQTSCLSFNIVSSVISRRKNR